MDEVNSVWETLGHRHPMRPKSKTESQGAPLNAGELGIDATNEFAPESWHFFLIKVKCFD